MIKIPRVLGNSLKRSKLGVISLGVKINDILTGDLIERKRRSNYSPVQIYYQKFIINFRIFYNESN